MTTVGLKTLKDKLSEYVRRAAAGETIVITDRDRPVAEIGPPRPHPETWRDRGIREGWLTPATIDDGSPPPRKPLSGLSFDQLMADLDHDRDDW